MLKAWKQHRGMIAVLAVGCCGVVLLTMLVVVGVTQSPPEGYVPTSPAPRPARGRLTGPVLFTVDASDPDRWTFFSFDEGNLVQNPGPLGWDLAFRRFQIVANGGDGFAGRGGIADLGEVSFDRIESVPGTGYVVNTVRGDTVNAALGDWYHYSYFSHLLTPKPRVYAVRAADGRYAKLQLLGYYCPGAMPGCVTFRYAFQGGGGVGLVPIPRASHSTTGKEIHATSSLPGGVQPGRLHRGAR